MMKIFFPILLLVFFIRARSVSSCFVVMFGITPALLSFMVYTPATQGGVLLDGIGVPLLLLSVWLTPLMIMASSFVSTNHYSLFLVVVCSLLFSLVVTFSVSSLLTFYFFFEASVLPACFLIAGWGYQPERYSAAFYLVLYTVGGSLPFLVILLMLFQYNNHTSFLISGWGVPSILTSSVWWMFVLLPFLVKTPIYSLHLWLPKAHVEAPVAGSMVLAGVLLKLGGYGMFRMSMLFPYANQMLVSAVASLSLWGSVLAAIICLRQVDVKSLIAYSSVAHMGPVVLGILSQSFWGWGGALLMMLAHGLTSSALFGLVGETYRLTDSRSVMINKGVLCLSPALGAWWFFGLAANSGAPPALNLVAEIILLTVTSFSMPWLSGLMGLILFFSLAYGLHLYGGVVHGMVSRAVHAGSMIPFSVRGKMMVGFHLVPVCVLFLVVDMLGGFALSRESEKSHWIFTPGFGMSLSHVALQGFYWWGKGK